MEHLAENDVVMDDPGFLNKGKHSMGVAVQQHRGRDRKVSANDSDVLAYISTKGAAKRIGLAECSNPDCRTRFDLALTRGDCPKCGGKPKRR